MRQVEMATRLLETPSWIDRASAGFALAAVILVTVAVVVPEVEAGGTMRASALADVNAIGVALREATGAADAGDARMPRWMFGPGVLPRGVRFAQDEGFPLSGLLVRNAVGAPRWRGPYLGRVPIDPWGRAYVVGFGAKDIVTIVSAGPDGVLNTTPRDGAIAGDDVGILLMP